MANLTADISVLSTYIHGLVEDEKASLSLEDVWYGDQQLIPRTPAVTIEPGRVDTTLNNTGMQATHEFEVELLVYHSELLEVNTTRLECIQLGESIRDLLNSDKQMDGHVVHGHVSRFEPGYATRQVLLQAVRLTWNGMSKTRI